MGKEEPGPIVRDGASNEVNPCVPPTPSLYSILKVRDTFPTRDGECLSGRN